MPHLAWEKTVDEQERYVYEAPSYVFEEGFVWRVVGETSVRLPIKYDKNNDPILQTTWCPSHSSAELLVESPPIFAFLSDAMDWCQRQEIAWMAERRIEQLAAQPEEAGE